MRTGELTEKVWHMFGAGYVKLTQVRAATGWADLNTADLMVMGEWPSTGNELHGFEIKISRSDWLNEVKNPRKNESVKSYCDRWWLVIADENMVKPGELPDDWGMMVWQGKGKRLKVVKKAPKLDAQPMDHCFVASLLRHNDKEMIPVDVHRDKLKDAHLAATALEKKRHEELYEFVRYIAKGFGIAIKERKYPEYGSPLNGKLFAKWYAQIKNGMTGDMDAEAFANRMVKAYHHDSLVKHVEWIKESLEKILATEDDPRNSARVWAEWALIDCKKFLEKEGK